MILDPKAYVAVVDSNDDTVALIQAWFEAKGLKVLKFKKAQDALYNLHPSIFKHKLQLLITDLYLNDYLTGKDLSDTLCKQHEGLSSMVIVNRPIKLNLDTLQKQTGYLFVGEDKLAENLTNLVA